jgi:hypothetical protein
MKPGLPPPFFLCARVCCDCAAWEAEPESLYPEPRHVLCRTCWLLWCRKEQRLASELDYLVFRSILSPVQVGFWLFEGLCALC